MNALLNTIRNSKNIIISKVLKNNSCITPTITRSVFGWKWDLKITWERPKKIPFFHPSRSGDCGVNHNVKDTDVAHNFSQCEEYKTADETVKKLLSLEYSSGKATNQKIREVVGDLVKRHKFDKQSIEYKIAMETSIITTLQKKIEGKYGLRKLKRFLGKLVNKRHRSLKRLRSRDYRRYEYLIERLNINYRTIPDPLHQVTRKDSLRKLTQKYHDTVINDKTNAYRTELESQQKDFYKEKAEKLAFIRSEELSLGLEPTVTEQEIAAAREKAEQLSQLK